MEKPMKSNTKTNIETLFISAIAGAFFYFILVYFWTYFPSVNPLFRWLLSCFTDSSWFKPVIYLQDMLANTLLCIPLALLLIKLNPKNVWPSVAIALVSIFLVGHYHLFLQEYQGWHINDFGLVWALQQIPLPMAILFLQLRKKREDT